MTSRPVPRWVVRGTAAGVTAALALGGLLVLSTDGPERAVAVTAPAPVGPASSATAAASAPAPAPAPTATPAPSVVAVPRPKPVAPPIRSAAQPDLDVSTVLGPPPGPQPDRRPARTAAPADRYAFLVGVQDYRRPTVDTIGSAKDVRFIQAALIEAGWLPQNIRVVLDREATGAAIRAGTAWLADRGRPGTFTYFHYSGHVKQRGGTREALWPVDRDFVDDTEVTAVLGDVQGRLWVDVAGCEAGSFLPGLPSGRTLFTGSSLGTEKSYEYPPWGMSVWTGLLFDLGLRQGYADADGDGRTTMGESLRYAQYHAQAITLGQQPHGRQTPEWAGADDLGWTLADPPA